MARGHTPSETPPPITLNEIITHNFRSPPYMTRIHDTQVMHALFHGWDFERHGLIETILHNSVLFLHCHQDEYKTRACKFQICYKCQ